MDMTYREGRVFPTYRYGSTTNGFNLYRYTAKRERTKRKTEKFHNAKTNYNFNIDI